MRLKPSPDKTSILSRPNNTNWTDEIIKFIKKRSRSEYWEGCKINRAGQFCVHYVYAQISIYIGLYTRFRYTQILGVHYAYAQISIYIALYTSFRYT